MLFPTGIFFCVQQRFGKIAADGTRISTLVFQFSVPSMLDGTQPNCKSIFQLINYIRLLYARGDGINPSQLRQAEDVVRHFSDIFKLAKQRLSNLSCHYKNINYESNLNFQLPIMFYYIKWTET